MSVIKKELHLEEFKKMTCGKEDQTKNFITHIENLTSVTIKVQRIKWEGHIVRMDEDRTTKKVFNTQITGTWRKGKPNLRWIYDLEKDILVLRTKNWITLAGRRLTWKRLLEKAKAHLGQSSY
ncbi:uncharacterized protein TNCV_1643241 [Trichonephila clavipes]|nr:uncharacterized protein TNCV_1643241 [Trichonephila clavipes]